MRSLTIGRVLDIPIRINVSLLLFLPILVWLIAGQIELYADVVNAVSPTTVDAEVLTEGETPWIIGVVAAVGLFVGVLLHELGHSVTAMRYGIGIASITLWIFGGLARMEDLPEDWSIEFWVALAGPVTSVALAGICYLALFAIPSSAPAVLIFVVAWLAVINLTLAIFNMLPAFPMDGGRIFRALLARNRPYVEATAIAAKTGRFFGVAMVLVGVLNFAPLLALVGFFVYVAAGAESRVVTLRDLLRDVRADDLLQTDSSTVGTDTTVQDLLQRMFEDRRTGYPVLDANGRLAGLVSLGALRSVPPADRSTVTVADVMSRDPPTVSIETPAFDVLERLAETGSDRVVVLEDDRLVGTLDNEAIVAYIDLVQGIGPLPETETPDATPPDGYA
ncbi:putative metalloprotease [Salinarchaeum sp. Harcht-Bsk1]|uniref:site-2 protease family protein n=1 Tax=Salinarchaeum sp. Harcht-Bsk1 TaxID=1333523 RepID=UPI000342450E|nr:site-2 protease family protein [Salinarchaeum sp. Harcht-Bsk1]AGN00706.1 putative metalloprotease [Salinarchaeum sp. Harcht-Bsk1]